MTELIHSLLPTVLWIAVALTVSAFAIAVLRKWRGGAYDAQPGPSELLTKFRELHVRGSLSDDEYRTIKTKLAAQVDTELKDNDKTS
jgi:uncharacterized membrane protein